MTRPATRPAAPVVALAAALAVAGCLRSGEERAERDLAVGRAEADGVVVAVVDGLAHVRSLVRDPGGGLAGAAVLWAQAPVVELTVDLAATAAGDWTLTVANVVADTDLLASAGGAPLAVELVDAPRPTVRTWRIAAPAGRVAVRVAPPDATDLAPWRFAVMGDIQDALPTVDDVFARIDAEPGLRFVISTGDIVQRGGEEEYVLFERQLDTLDLPFYSTIGNHELWDDVDRWYRRFGRATVHWRFRDVTFSLVDSAAATIDPTVDGWLDDWLDEARGGIHVFATHYPPIDPIGVRQGSLASVGEGRALLARLATGQVDLTLYGHIHTYVGFDNAGIPAHISGGGGAEPMRLDHVGRHFLVVDVDPGAGRVTGVRVVRVEPEGP